MSSGDFNDVLDDINFNEHRRHRVLGFTRGYSAGEEAGWREGYLFGVRKGGQLAAEIGFYQGFAHAWIGVLEKDDVDKQRKLTALRTLLEMTRSFPKANVGDEDTLQKLGRIRAKFKQINSLVYTPGDGGSGGGSFGKQSFSGASWTSQDSGAGTYSSGSMQGQSPQMGQELSF